MKNISFVSENFQFLEVEFPIYLNRRVFVMLCMKTKIIQKNVMRAMEDSSRLRNC